MPRRTDITNNIVIKLFESVYSRRQTLIGNHCARSMPRLDESERNWPRDDWQPSVDMRKSGMFSFEK